MALSAWEKLKLLAHIARWRATWSRHDLDYFPDEALNDKFITARRAATLIEDGDVVVTSGMAGNARCSIFYWAIKDRFMGTAHPRGLTWISVSAHGSRGRVPGTVEELGMPGLITRYVAGHAETKKSILRLAGAGKLELHTMPQGQMTFVFEAQARGEDSVLGDAGVGTFLDPRVGTGSEVTRTGAQSLSTAEGDKLRYTLPKIQVALFVAPACDREGNIYMENAACYTESLESSLAARANGGRVIASVAEVIEKDEARIFMTADQVDHIVVNPFSEQTGSIPQLRYWKMFTPESDVSLEVGVEKLRFANNVLKITPVREAVDDSLARLAATWFTRMSRAGSLVNIGVGLPEEVARLLQERGLLKDLTLFTETGCIGGLPAPGIFFGAAVCPERLTTSAKVFHLAYEKLDTTILGVLECDSDGNINVSKRGEGAINYVGPGGLPDLATAAKNVLFVGSWMAHQKLEIRAGEVRIVTPGAHKFIRAVDEITFSGKQALAAGKTVHYVTNVGVFRLTERGMMLVEVMPGIDVQRDILDACPMRVVLPEDGHVPVVDASIVTGKGFCLGF